MHAAPSSRASRRADRRLPRRTAPVQARRLSLVAGGALLSPCGRGGDPLRSNGEVRGLPPLRARGGKPLTLPASRVPPERLSKGLSRKGRGKGKAAPSPLIAIASPLIVLPGRRRNRAGRR